MIVYSSVLEIECVTEMVELIQRWGDIYISLSPEGVLKVTVMCTLL